VCDVCVRLCIVFNSSSQMLTATLIFTCVAGWRFKGLLAQADDDALGIDWECES
jgi:hypothetical protein